MSFYLNTLKEETSQRRCNTWKSGECLTWCSLVTSYCSRCLARALIEEYEKTLAYQKELLSDARAEIQQIQDEHLDMARERSLRG